MTCLISVFMWIGANNNQIWLPRSQNSEFEQCSNRLQLDLIWYIFLYARFVVWFAIDLLLLLVNIWFSANNYQVWLLEARWMIFSNIRTDLNLIFGQFSVARKLILNGEAIRPTGLLLLITITWHPIIHNCKAEYINVSVILMLIDIFRAYIRVLIISSIRG